MKNIIEKFKRSIRLVVTIFASREFGFIYCLAGTVTQIWHTYYLTYNISSLQGNTKTFQALLLSFFISSSLLFFVAIADSEDTKESKRIRLAVNIFMFIEIIINFYYYARHLIIDSEETKIFDFIFAILVSCLIPVTIKLYASLIRAKEWMDEINNEIEPGTNKTTDFDYVKIQDMIDSQIDKFKIKFDEEQSNNTDYDYEKNVEALLKSQITELKETILSDIDSDISLIFQKNQQLFLQQFENKCKIALKKELETIKTE